MAGRLRREIRGAIDYVMSRGDRREDILRNEVDRLPGEHEMGEDSGGGREPKLPMGWTAKRLQMVTWKNGVTGLQEVTHRSHGTPAGKVQVMV